MRTCRCVPFPYLGNGWTDFAEIWYVVRDLQPFFAKVNGGAQLHVYTPFSYLRNGRTDCAKIWYVVRDPLAKLFTRVDVSK